jgi:hypothetical protein
MCCLAARVSERFKRLLTTEPGAIVGIVMEAQPLRVVENVACTGCGCVCDDLRLTVRGERIVRAERACVLAEP